MTQPKSDITTVGSEEKLIVLRWELNGTNPEGCFNNNNSNNNNNNTAVV